MDHDTGSLVPRKGMTIIGSDGETVGEIDLVEATYVIVTKGLFPQDHYIALRDIEAEDEDGTLRLAIPAQEALDKGLGNPMVGAESERAELSHGAMTEDIAANDADAMPDSDPDSEVVEDAGMTPAATTPPEDVADVPEPEALEAAADDDLDIAPDTEPVRDDMHRTVTLSAEDVTATTRPVERGVVHVEKKVVEERVTLEVPLVEDEVHVTRRRVDREITDTDAPFEEGHIEIPLRGQGVEIEKRAQVVEEVDIDKTAHQHVETITETVRHEEARVEGDGTEGAIGDPPEDA